MSWNFSDLKGVTIRAIEVRQGYEHEIIFATTAGTFRMFHSQDCCESVTIEEIIGDLDDLIGNPILLAEEISGGDELREPDDKLYYGESYTWTFYKLSTIKGSVTIRWFGTSNGNYSERVSFRKVDK